MNVRTKLYKATLVVMMSFGMVYCGSSGGDGTQGTVLTVEDSSGNTVTISVPEVEASKIGGITSNDIQITMSVEETQYFSHFEIERKIGSAPFAYVGDNFSGQMQDLDKTNNTYRYRASAVYLVDGIVHISNVSSEDSVTIGTIGEASVDK